MYEYLYSGDSPKGDKHENLRSYRFNVEIRNVHSGITNINRSTDEHIMSVTEHEKSNRL